MRIIVLAVTMLALGGCRIGPPGAFDSPYSSSSHNPRFLPEQDVYFRQTLDAINKNTEHEILRLERQQGRNTVLENAIRPGRSR